MPTVTSKNREEFNKKEMKKKGALQEKKLRLYHGGWDKDLDTVQEKGAYEGLFGNQDKRSAESHGGGYLHYADIPERKILTHYDLNYEIPHKKVTSALEKAHLRLMGNKELSDKVHEIVIGDKGNRVHHLNEEELREMFGTEDHTEAGIEAQRLRGQVSKNLGYHAVELEDEHGTSYLIQPGVKMHKVNSDD